ncbi:hypothetical protein Tco_0659037 [Tanacetum coccineum]
MSYELLMDIEKKQLGKNEESKITIYNALPCKEYERVFMCKTAKEVWHTLIITHQGNSQVNNCKINLLIQEYEKFSISNEETIDSGFTRFNDIITSLKSLVPDYSNKNHVRKFLRALPLKWRAKVTAIEEAKENELALALLWRAKTKCACCVREAEEQDVDPLIKLAKAAATAAADTSSIPADDNQSADIPPGSSTPTTAFGSATNVPTGPSVEFADAPFNKGKSPMIEEDPPIKQRSFRQLEEDRLGAEAAKKLYDEEQAGLAREQ